MKIIEIIQPDPPETPWDELETGKPAMIYGYRGIGSSSRSRLTPQYQGKLGRSYLLGPGIYIAPSKTMAAHYGDTSIVRIKLYNPYVIRHANTNTLVRLPLTDIQAIHDGIIIQSGKIWNEDLRQAVLFPQYANQVDIGITKPKITTLQPGAKVKIINIPPSEQTERGFLLGKTGIVTSMLMNHPRVRIGGKIYFISRQDVQIIT